MNNKTQNPARRLASIRSGCWLLLALAFPAGFFSTPASAQSSMIIEAFVQRIPTGDYALSSCEKEPLLMAFDKGQLLILTTKDTLHLVAVEILPATPGIRRNLSVEKLHGDQQYMVTLMESDKGITLIASPVRGGRRLYSMIISSIDMCN